MSSDPVRSRAVPSAGAGAVLLMAVLLLAGCAPAPAPSPSPSPTVSVTATPAPRPTLDLTGTAGENLAYFDQVNKALIAKGGPLDGRAFVDNLVAAGYPKTSMEVTPDRTSVNLEADNIEFSVRLGSTCLIGEYGNIGYASTAAKVFSTGRCLAGKTRTIDW